MIPPIARNFIAGKTAESAVSDAQKVSKDGITPIVNYLGEHYEDKNKVDKTIDKYKKVLKFLEDRISGDYAISIKPSQMGLDISEEYFHDNAYNLVEYAISKNAFVWIDMEKSDTVDATLSFYKSVVSEFPGNVGVCLQANLKRTINDIMDLCEYESSRIRIVKGAYKESPDIAYQDKSRIDENYKDLIEYSINNMQSTVSVGSHDQNIIDHALSIQEDNESSVEIQMLKGVRTDKQIDLSESDIKVAQYIPYGKEWISYTYRRIREKPSNVFLLGRAVYDNLKTKVFS